MTVIEYASFVCDHCAAWHNDSLLPQFKARFIDTGKVKLVFRNLPTEPADAAFAAAALAAARRPSGISTSPAASSANPPCSPDRAANGSLTPSPSAAAPRPKSAPVSTGPKPRPA